VGEIGENQQDASAALSLLLFEKTHLFTEKGGRPFSIEEFGAESWLLGRKGEEAIFKKKEKKKRKSAVRRSIASIRAGEQKKG